MTDVQFGVSAAFDRKLFWEAGQSVRYLVARVKATRQDDQETRERTPLNIALVIDASGSMGGGKLEAAKQAAIGLAERLTEQDRLSIVSFASDVQVHLDAVAVTTENVRQIRSAIHQLETRGCTNLSDGWFAGVECAARVAERNARMTPRVIILSDGHANEGISDPAELCEHAAELRLRGIQTSALGIGDGYDEQLLKGIAENGGGRLHDAELTSEISSVLLGELDDIFGTVVEDAQISVSTPEGVRVDLLGTGQTVSRGGEIRANLGPVQNDIERVAIFKVTCPTAPPGIHLSLEISATGRSVDDHRVLGAKPAEIRLTSADAKTNSAQKRDKILAEIIARTWSAYVVSTAARMNRDRAFEEAAEFVKRELVHFRRYVEDLESGGELTRELELLAQRVRHSFSSRVRKEMVFQSASMMESRRDHRGTVKASWSERMLDGH